MISKHAARLVNSRASVGSFSIASLYLFKAALCLPALNKLLASSCSGSVGRACSRTSCLRNLRATVRAIVLQQPSKKH